MTILQNEPTKILTPAQSPKLIGHNTLVSLFLGAAQHQKLHHAWLLTGAEGIGKATFAWHAGRYLLDLEGGAPHILARSPDALIQRQISAGSAHGFFLLERAIDPKTNKKRREIVIEQIRTLKARLGLSNPDKRYQVVIIDTAEDMNANAANALLKLLEEPPSKVIFFLISHRPGYLLAPIRSRCITHHLFALSDQDFQKVQKQINLTPDPIIMALSQGSPGIALRLSEQNGAEIYTLFLALFDGHGHTISRTKLNELCDILSGNEHQERFSLFITLLQIFFARFVRAKITGNIKGYLDREKEILNFYQSGINVAQSSAELSEHLCARLIQGRNVNIDTTSLIVDMARMLEKTVTQWTI